MIALFVLLLALPADTLDLRACYALAEAHHPRRDAVALQDRLAALRLANLDVRFLPAVSLQSQVTYQSAVPSFPLSVPGASLPEISHDQYRVSLNVDQLVYDGGATRAQQAVERVQRDLASQSVHVEIYQVRAQVDEVYFGALAAEAQLAQLATLAEDLAARHHRLEAQVRAGAVTPGNADVLAVERLRVAQQMEEAAAARRMARDVLAELIGRPIGEAVLAAPDFPGAEPAGNERRRPEYALFTLNRFVLTEQEALADVRQRPRVMGFLETAYGRPAGLDLFDNRFQPFYSFGVRVQWSPWDWKATERDRQSLAIQREVIDTREAAFTQQLDVAEQRFFADVERLQALLAQDDEIIALRARIAEAAASQLENGVATATDYLIERNAEHQARLTRDLHALQLARVRAAYATTMGAD